MFDEMIACLDGSSLAETILPLARGLTAIKGGTLTLLRVVADAAELSAEENYLRDCARQYSGQARFVVAADPAGAIGAELERNPNAISALTTHGRTAWAEAILGSVALRVIRAAKRPVMLYCPIEKNGDAPKIIETVVVPLDGQELSEKIIPYAAKAAEIKKLYQIKPQWDVLHSDPADAICRYVRTMPNILLAMTTHARGAVERAMLGSVAAQCIRHAGVPLLLYWPKDR